MENRTGVRESAPEGPQRSEGAGRLALMGAAAVRSVLFLERPNARRRANEHGLGTPKIAAARRRGYAPDRTGMSGTKSRAPCAAPIVERLIWPEAFSDEIELARRGVAALG